MKVSIEIKDEKQLEVFEKLRGEKSAKEFAQICLDVGLRTIITNAVRQKNAVRFSAAKPEFRKLDIAAITEALKTKDSKNEVVMEVDRLVKAYSAELGELARKNGNRLPKSMQVNAQSAIEKVAFQITADLIKNAAAKQTAETKIAA